MKNKFLLGVLALMLAFSFALTGCSSGDDDNGGGGGGGGGGSGNDASEGWTAPTFTATSETSDSITINVTSWGEAPVIVENDRRVMYKKGNSFPKEEFESSGIPVTMFGNTGTISGLEANTNYTIVVVIYDPENESDGAYAYKTVKTKAAQSSGGANPFEGTWVGTDVYEYPVTLVCTGTTWTATYIGDGEENVSGTYTYSGNTATIKYSGETIGTATLAGNTLTVTSNGFIPYTPWTLTKFSGGGGIGEGVINWDNTPQEAKDLFKSEVKGWYNDDPDELGVFMLSLGLSLPPDPNTWTDNQWKQCYEAFMAFDF